MKNEILINAEHGETRVAVLERGLCTELLIERTGSEDVVGSVIKGRVTRVLPGMQAAFVDIGLDKAAFLFAGDYYTDDGDDDDAKPRGRGGRGGRNGGRGGGRNRQPPRIDTLLKEGEEIVVQVAKEAIGTKGARITSNISIAGRHLVLTPRSKRVGVSRRIDSDKERRRLREIVTRLRPKDLGFITRTAGENVREADIEADIKYLANVWEEVQNGKSKVSSPAVLYEEPRIPIRVIRDLASNDTKRIIVDNLEVFEEMTTFVDRFMADPKPHIEFHHDDIPIFEKHGVEAQIDGALQRKVFMKSGGYLIIDQSEALTAIDVNTGSYVGKRDLEETVLRTNLEAVKEIAHQLRFRNIGGLLILDFIDMEDMKNREKVNRALQEEIRGDKARTNILKISELGLVEMTRKRTRENLVQVVGEPCGYCEGKGFTLSSRSVAYKVLRSVRRDLVRFSGRQVALSVAPAVAELLLGEDREALAELSQEVGREIEVRARPGMHHEQFEVEALDEGPPVAVTLSWLGTPDGSTLPEDDADDEANESPSEAPTAVEEAAAEAAAEAEATPPEETAVEAAGEAEEAAGPAGEPEEGSSLVPDAPEADETPAALDAAPEADETPAALDAPPEADETPAALDAPPEADEARDPGGPRCAAGGGRDPGGPRCAAGGGRDPGGAGPANRG
ncbi:MAG: Rne/Rng family ribonuclease [Deltaproteobacteria bacterium]|nr:Rne/Rng family ribonuclease [Deltaproteobacteria bacterium]